MKAFLDAGAGKYANATMEDQSKAHGPGLLDTVFGVKPGERLFREVAGEYVENRVWAYTDCLGRLRDIERRVALGELAVDKAEDEIVALARKYNVRMARQEFGYQARGTRVLSTTEHIDADSKRFLDNKVLGGQISDRFVLSGKFVATVTRTLNVGCGRIGLPTNLGRLMERAEKDKD